MHHRFQMLDLMREGASVLTTISTCSSNINSCLGILHSLEVLFSYKFIFLTSRDSEEKETSSFLRKELLVYRTPCRIALRRFLGFLRCFAAIACSSLQTTGCRIRGHPARLGSWKTSPKTQLALP